MSPPFEPPVLSLSLQPQAYIDAIQDMFEELVSRRDARSFFEHIARRVKELFGADGVAVGMWVDGRWVVIASAGVAAELVREMSGKIAEGESLSGRIQRTAQPLQVGNVLLEESFRFKEAAQRHGLFSFVGAPMIIAGKVIGTVELYQSTPRVMDDETLRLLGSFASMAAVAARSLEDFKQLTDGLKSAEAAFEAARLHDRRKGDFLSHLSHELRSPMVMIRGWLELILRGQFGPLSAKQRHGLEVALRNTDKLVELVDNLKAISRMSSPGFHLNPQPVLVSQLVAEALKAAHPRAQDRQVTLRSTIDLEPDTTGEMDKDRLLMALGEVLGNAVAHARQGGLVKVSVSMAAGHGATLGAGVRMWADQRQADWADLVMISVTDDGVGFGLEIKEVLHDRFLKHQDTPDTPLTGLAMVREVLNLHGGELFLENAREGGGLCRLVLPLSPPG